MCQSSMMENIDASDVQKTLYQLERMQNFLRRVSQGELGGSKCGSTIRYNLPLLYPFIVTSDYKLGRRVLAGDRETNLKESATSDLMKVLNLIDSENYNILTEKTTNTEREKTRKAIAPAFSTSNLQQTWPYTKEIIVNQFREFDRIDTSIGSATSSSNGFIEMREAMVHFFLRTLTSGAFGIEFTTDGTESDDNINGLAYLQELEIAVREGTREISNPFRKWMFWDDDVKRAATANKRLGEMVAKLVRLHRARDANDRFFSILDHVMKHSYSSEIARICDLNILNVGAIETTAYTCCFLLMELARHTEIKLKLQNALAVVMPTRSDASLPSLRAPGETKEFSRADKDLLTAINGVEYLGWCIKEVMRLWPVAGEGPGRELAEDIEHNGMLLPKGSFVNVHLWSVFRESWIDRAEEFIPERWAETNPQLPELKEMFMPFSLGRRACLGQNMANFQLRVVAAHFLHYYDFELMGEPQFEQFISLKPYDLRMRVRKRTA